MDEKDRHTGRRRGLKLRMLWDLMVLSFEAEYTTPSFIKIL